MSIINSTKTNLNKKNKNANKNQNHPNEYNDDNNITSAPNLELLLVTATDISGILYYVGYNKLVFKAEDVLGKVVNPEAIGRVVNGEFVPFEFKMDMDAFRTNLVVPYLEPDVVDGMDVANDIDVANEMEDEMANEMVEEMDDQQYVDEVEMDEYA